MTEDELKEVAKKYERWSYFWEWDGKELGKKTHPFTSGWYPVRVVVNKHNYQTNCFIGYWTGKDWKKHHQDEDVITEQVFAYIPVYSGEKEEAEDYVKNFNPDEGMYD